MKFKALFAAGAVAASLSAQAANTVFINDYTFEPRAAVPSVYADTASNFITSISVSGGLPVPPPAGLYTGAGQMSGLLNGNSFVAYCVEISVLVQFGNLYTDYIEQVGAAGFGTRAGNLASLVTWAHAAGLPGNAAQSAALQAAVWEVVHESTDGAYSFASGKLQSASQNAATQAALNNIQANWSTIMATSPNYTVSRLDGATQDLLIFAPVPEAGTFALMALGLAGVGFAARMRLQA